MRRIPTLIVAAGLLLSGGAAAHAERYAVLVGVGKYANPVKPLAGPVFDIAALRERLVKNGYKEASITVLLNEQGIRQNIVQALRATVEKMRAGDHLLFYYSGHGTSAFDRNFAVASADIGPDSGALATYDLSLSDPAAAVQTLVIGRRDIRPVLEKLPAGAQGLVILDACYSENSAKSVSVLPSPPIRGINLVDLIEHPAPEGNAPAPVAPRPPPASAPEPYPYPNIVSLAAASKEQPAVDITEGAMQTNPAWRTIDGHAHGALTNALLEALSGKADTNHDGTITYDELFRFIRRDMEKYPHQPQLLSARGFSLDQSMFGSAKATIPAGNTSPVAPRQGMAPLRVAVRPSQPALEKALRTMPEVSLSSGAFDLLVQPVPPKSWGIYDASGVLLVTVDAGGPEAVAARVRAQALLGQLRAWTDPGQTFNVRIDAEPDGATGYDKLRSVFRVGERVRVRISTERPAFLLLLGLDKDGRATVLFPGPPLAEHAQQPAGKTYEFVIQANAPAGAEQLKLVAFPERPDTWDEWGCGVQACPSFAAADPELQKLLGLLRGYPGASEASLRVITQQ